MQNMLTQALSSNGGGHDGNIVAGRAAKRPLALMDGSLSRLPSMPAETQMVGTQLEQSVQVADEGEQPLAAGSTVDDQIEAMQGKVDLALTHKPKKTMGSAKAKPKPAGKTKAAASKAASLVVGKVTKISSVGVGKASRRQSSASASTPPTMPAVGKKFSPILHVGYKIYCSPGMWRALKVGDRVDTAFRHKDDPVHAPGIWKTMLKHIRDHQ